MGEVGCLKDGHFQNLQVDGLTELSSDGTVGSTVTKKVAIVTGVTVNETAGDSPAIGTFAQPANTIITGVKVFCAVAPICDSLGDLGAEVGTTSSGGQIVALVSDGIMDGSGAGAGVTVIVGNVRTLTLVAEPAVAGAPALSIHYASAARTIYCNIVNTVDATPPTVGSFTFIIEYVKIA